ncbi:MAG: hypothetical protein IJ794_05640 [Lachnospiraceae bacterium]|nr:hypothetical protein [Lachnospiraceae bacterium]
MKKGTKTDINSGAKIGNHKSVFAIWLAVAWLLLLLVVVGGVTYAWFNFQPYTNVEPMSSVVSGGEVALLIAADPEAEFGMECLLPASSGKLNPLSTADLDTFYTAVSQDRQGITNVYKNATDRVEEDTIHGVFYLKSLDDNCDVYFYQPNMNFGEDAQMLAAMRLGLRITKEEQAQTWIFDLDEMGNTSGAAGERTTAQANVVVEDIGSDGSPVYEGDPSLSMSDFFAVPSAGSGERQGAGNRALCRINANEVVMVEYWLYLEGCDENCINAVQGREAGIQLSFAGVEAPEPAGTIE